MLTHRSRSRAEQTTRRHPFDAVPLVVAVFVGAIDQITKALVIHAYGPTADGKGTTLIPNLLELRHDQNTGAAFSRFEGQNLFLLVLGVVVIAGLIYYYRALPQGKPVLRVAVGAVLGGAVGNIIDRIRLGHVTDWIHVFHAPNFNYPTFNFADSCITVGMITIALSLFLADRAESRR